MFWEPRGLWRRAIQLDGVCVLLVGLRPGTHMREAQVIQGAIDGVVRHREPELLMQPHDQIAGPPAHHAVDRRDRALVYDPAEKGFVHVVELGRCARRRDVRFGNPRESPNRSVGIIRSRVQLEKIAETLVPQMAQKAREIGISANGVRAQNPRAGRLNQVDPPLASITSSSVRNPVRGALTSTAMLPGGCRLVRINSCACGILVQGNTSLMQGSTRRSSTN